MSRERLVNVVDQAYDRLRAKINGGRIRVDNEASLQLQLASILKTIGELYETERDEIFTIELEKSVNLSGSVFGKSGSEKARIDIFLAFEKIGRSKRHACAIELKYFKKENHREPNNRYDVFVDIRNLEHYGSIVDCGFLIVATDHDHYVTHQSYSLDTADFDFTATPTWPVRSLSIEQTRPTVLQ